ncbi:hypothetical protein MTR_8g065750 [Medicago truncatula]|uniref:Uncharacterized protein n=1 Tax=Medicago truncatula TaxID=3880 RepID=G7LG74_MEDTR|nr:hypothetical protein MTR_8g065750 [Medicago truncatula]
MSSIKYPNNGMETPSRSVPFHPAPFHSAPCHIYGCSNNTTLKDFTITNSYVGPSNLEPLVFSSDATKDSTFKDANFSEAVKYISHILMEKDFEQKPCMCYDPLSLLLRKFSLML